MDIKSNANQIRSYNNNVSIIYANLKEELNLSSIIQFKCDE